MSATVTLDPAELRSLVKAAVTEALNERFDAVVEEYEDQCLARAIMEVDPDDIVPREEIMRSLGCNREN